MNADLLLRFKQTIPMFIPLSSKYLYRYLF